MEKQEGSNTSTYDVALSFAGEDRDFVDKVVSYLKVRIKIFYDYNEKPELAGAYLPPYLVEVYSKKSCYAVVFISRFYNEKKWTKFELQCMLEREVTEPNYIIPVRLDDTEIPGILSTKGFIDGVKESPEDIANIIIKKVLPNSPKGQAIINNMDAKELIVVDWRITSHCDHECRCCFGPKKIDPVSLENAIRIADILHEQGVRTICISGGEPLTYPKIDKLLEYLSGKGFTIYLSTNGNHFDEHKEAIESYVKKLSLSLDGYSEDIHSRFGRSPDNFRKVMSILDSYNRTRPKIQIKIGTLLSTNNINAPNLLMKMFNLLEKYPIDIWKIYELVPEGKVRYEAYPCECETELFNLIIDKFESDKIRSSPRFQVVYSRRKDRNKAYFILQPDGTVIIPEDMGNVVEEKCLGNILMDPIDKIIDLWKNQVNYENYKNNISMRYLTSRNYPRRLEYQEEIILRELVKDPTQTAKQISEAIQIPLNHVDGTIKSLHERGILKNIIPVINVSKLGFTTFNLFVSVEKTEDLNKESIFENLKNHPSIPWIVSTSGKWDFIIAVFTDPRHLAFIMTDINKICNDKIKSYEILSLYEEYLFGQRYLFKTDKEKWIMINDYWMPLDDAPTSSLSKKEYGMLAKITGYKQPSLFDFSTSYGDKYKEVSEDVILFKRKGILVRFIPTCDINLLNYEWHILLIRLKNLTEDNLLDFKKFIASFPQVIHIVLGIGDWDVKIEIHADNLGQVQDIVQQINNKYCDIILKKDNLKIIKEYKLDFLVDAVFERRG